MAIAPTVLTSNIDNVDRNAYTTASVSLTAHQSELVLVSVMSRHGSASPNQPTFTTAQGGTWTAVTTVVHATDFARLTVFRACASSFTDGTLVIDFGGQTQIIAAWEVASWTGTGATVANNGSDAIGDTQAVISAANGTSTPAITMATPAAGSAHFSCNMHAANEVTTPKASPAWTELSDKNAGTPATGFETEWILAGDTSPGASWTSSTHPRGIIGVEIKAPGFTDFVGIVPI